MISERGMVMKLQEKCIPCIVNQAIKVANLIGMEDKSELLKEMFKYLSTVDYSEITSPELIGENFCVLKKLTGNENPYRETRDTYNRMFLEKINLFEERISKSDNEFLEAIKYAIIDDIKP